MNYKVSYEDASLNMSSRPYAQKVCDLEQPLTSRVVIETMSSDPAGRMIYFDEKLRNGSTRLTALEVVKQKDWRWKRWWTEQKNQAGEVIRREFNQVSHPAFSYPPGVVTPQVMWLTLRDLNFKAGAQSTSFVYMNPTLMANVSVRVVGQETIKAPAGTFACWKVLITPHAEEYFGSSVGSLIQRFIPSYTIWMETAPTRRIVKYRGVLGQMPSTVLIYFNFELTSFK